MDGNTGFLETGAPALNIRDSGGYYVVPRVRAKIGT